MIAPGLSSSRRRSKLHIVRFRAHRRGLRIVHVHTSVNAHSLHRSSSPNKTRFAGLLFGKERGNKLHFLKLQVKQGWAGCPQAKRVRRRQYRVYGKARSQSIRASCAAINLPRSFSDAGDLAFICQLTEAYTANAVVTQISVGTTADFAAIVLSGRELRRSCLLDLH